MSLNKPVKPATDIDAVRRSAFWHLGRHLNIVAFNRVLLMMA